MLKLYICVRSERKGFVDYSGVMLLKQFVTFMFHLRVNERNGGHLAKEYDE